MPTATKTDTGSESVTPEPLIASKEAGNPVIKVLEFEISLILNQILNANQFSNFLPEIAILKFD